MTRMKLILLPLLLVAAVASAQTTIPVDIELGYRWLDLKGDESTYRSQINEESGFLLRSLTYSAQVPTLDYFRLDANELGSGPAGSVRLEAGNSAYRVNLRYLKADSFSALPTIALGQHTFDRTRDLVDADLQILRWSKFKPFIGYTFNRYQGPGTTTYTIGQDEFLLLQELSDTDREIRVGTTFEIGKFFGQVTQGWRSFSGTERLTLAPGTNAGNNPGNVLDRPVTIGTLNRIDRTNVDAPFTSFNVGGFATERIRVFANYHRFDSDADGSGSEAVTGSFVSFPLSRFFTGLAETTASRAENQTERFGARAEFNVAEGYDFVGGWQHESRELSGSSLINTIFLQSITFGGADPRDIRVILDTENGLEREEDIINVAFVARPKGPFSFRAGIGKAIQDVVVSQDLSEIVVPGPSQSGSFDRQVNVVDVSGAFAKWGFLIGAAYKRENADEPILRTDFLERQRVRMRAAYRAPRWVRVGLTAERTNQGNDRADARFDAVVRQYGGDIEVAPFDMLTLRGSATRFRADSEVLFRRPENFETGTSVNIERGKSIEGGLTFNWSRFAFDGGLSRFENEGSLPFRIDRTTGRLTLQLWRQFGLAAEWAHDKYRDAPAFGDYEADRYGVYLRLAQ